MSKICKSVAWDRIRFAISIYDGDVESAKKYLLSQGVMGDKEQWDSALLDWKQKYRKGEVKKEKEEKSWIEIVVKGKGKVKIKLNGKVNHHD